MKTVMNHIWKIYSVIFIVMLFAISGCKDDPTSPEEKIDDKPITTVTIGPGGGTVGTEDVSIIIPAGAFSADHELAIIEVADDGAFGENSVSKPYKITGLPNDYTKPIKIKMKYIGQLEGESYIAVGRNITDNFSSDSSIVYSLQDVKDSSGFLISELPHAVNGSLEKHGSTSDKISDKHIEAITKYAVAITNNFIIDYPLFLDPEIDKIMKIVEDVIKLIKVELKIPSYRIFVNRTILIGIMYESVTYSPDFLPYSNQHFNISAHAVSNNEFNDIKVLFGRALFGYELDEGFLGPWLYNAFSKYLEGLLIDDPGFKYPYGFEQYHMAPFNGMQISNEGDALEVIKKNAAHGIGMSSVIKYLVDSPHFEKTSIGKMYKYIYENTDVNTTTVLLNNIDAPVTDWLPDFFKEYVSGNIYSQPIDKFLSNANDSWDINSVEDTLKEFKSSNFLIRKYQDLSAKMFKINLNYEPLDTTSRMLFSMSWAGADLDGLSMVMFGIKGGEQEYLGTADAQDFEIPNLKSYYKDGMKQFLVVLVNSNITKYDYLGESDIDLKVQLKKPKLDFTKCEVSIKVLTDISYENMDLEGNWSTTTTKASFRVASVFDAIGSFTGNTFTGSYTHYTEGDLSVYRGTITVTVNEAASMVTDVSLAGTIDYQNGSKVEKGFSGTGTKIPFTPNSDDNISLYQLYGFTGANVCEGINDVYYYEEHYSDGELLYKHWIDGYSSDNQGEIIIKLKKE